jgi:hypothetical protein
MICRGKGDSFLFSFHVFVLLPSREILHRWEAFPINLCFSFFFLARAKKIVVVNWWVTNLLTELEHSLVKNEQL